MPLIVCRRQCNYIHYYVRSTEDAHLPTHPCFLLKNNKTTLCNRHELAIWIVYSASICHPIICTLFWTPPRSVCSTDCEKERITKCLRGENTHVWVVWQHLHSINIDWYPSIGDLLKYYCLRGFFLFFSCHVHFKAKSETLPTQWSHSSNNGPKEEDSSHAPSLVSHPSKACVHIFVSKRCVIGPFARCLQQLPDVGACSRAAAAFICSLRIRDWSTCKKANLTVAAPNHSAVGGK